MEEIIKFAIKADGLNSNSLRFEEFVDSYDIVKRRCRGFECGRKSCENFDTGEAPSTLNKKIKKFMILCFRVVVITAKLDFKNVVSKMSAMTMCCESMV